VAAMRPRRGLGLGLLRRASDTGSQCQICARGDARSVRGCQSTRRSALAKVDSLDRCRCTRTRTWHPSDNARLAPRRQRCRQREQQRSAAFGAEQRSGGRSSPRQARLPAPAPRGRRAAAGATGGAAREQHAGERASPNEQPSAACRRCGSAPTQPPPDARRGGDAAMSARAKRRGTSLGGRVGCPSRPALRLDCGRIAVALRPPQPSHEQLQRVRHAHAAERAKRWRTHHRGALWRRA
jgi:hypothetical protein